MTDDEQWTPLFPGNEDRDTDDDSEELRRVMKLADRNLDRAEAAEAALSRARDRNASLELALDQLRQKYAAMDKDYRRSAEELADMRRPEMRVGREKLLLMQLGEMQTQLFAAQADMRQANVALDAITGNSQEKKLQLKAHAQKLLDAGAATFAREARVGGCREEVATRDLLALTSGDADDTDDYYEKVRDVANRPLPKVKE